MSNPVVIGRINIETREWLAINVNAIITAVGVRLKAHVCGNYYRSCEKYAIREWRRIPYDYLPYLEVIHLPANEQYLHNVEVYEGGSRLDNL